MVAIKLIGLIWKKRNKLVYQPQNILNAISI